MQRDVPHRVVPPGAGHHRHDRPALRWRRVAACTGALAAVLALGIGLFTLSTGDDTTSPGPVGPPETSARHLTARPSAMPLSNPQILQLLQRPPDLGPLDYPKPCLNSLDQPAGTRILGATPVSLGARAAVLLVLPAPDPSSLIAVVVAPDCPAGGTGVLARTVLARP
ncbi:hypothetical protein [Mycolicibacterium sp. P9-22]|uniref:hypothetical protein n=1 Tax=Mycolicibacterium sp. P9-22 TaxID=2024613 RepID=UPI0011EF25CF|nr:hypothetical protein [Mycolicibacterium sp. P9-22]